MRYATMWRPPGRMALSWSNPDAQPGISWQHAGMNLPRPLALLAALAALPACVQDAAAGPCRPEAAAALAGRPFTAEAALMAATGASLVRRISPGAPVTMDFLADRLTVEVDAAGRIVRASCG